MVCDNIYRQIYPHREEIFMYDILIKNGQIIDGSGNAAFFADIAIKDGKVVLIQPEIKEIAAEIIDAKGLQVSPGFIDNHSHSDDRAFWGSDSYNYLEQGVTTQITGQCGDSPAPYYEGALDGYKEGRSEEEFNRLVEMSKSASSFLAGAEKQTFGTNYAFFVGHGALRGKAMGYSDAKPTEEQMNIMKAELKDAMDAGYLGYTSGLVYAPSVYGDEAELTELAKVLVPYGGVYASHIRGEGDNVLRSVKEAIAVGENSGCEVLISHLKVMGKQNEGMSVELLKAIDEANDRGVVVNADQYPYMAGSAPLASQIPPRFMVGGMEVFLERIAKPEVRKEVLFAIFHEVDIFESSIYSAGFDGSLIVGASKTPQYVNKTIGQIAKEEDKEPVDVLCDILIANEGRVQGVYFNQSGTDLIRIMGHPRVFCGSDWSDYPDSRYDYEKEGGGHPRATGTMVRRLELVRDFRLRTMEESIKNVTYDTAVAMHIDGLGLIKEGWDANICIFAYDKLHACCDYAHPFRKNVGIEWVIVNGKIAVKNGTALGVRAGKVLKRKKN